MSVTLPSGSLSASKLACGGNKSRQAILPLLSAVNVMVELSPRCRTISSPFGREPGGGQREFLAPDSFTSATQVSESRPATERSLLLGFSISYSIRRNGIKQSRYSLRKWS